MHWRLAFTYYSHTLRLLKQQIRIILISFKCVGKPENNAVSVHTIKKWPRGSKAFLRSTLNTGEYQIHASSHFNPDWDSLYRLGGWEESRDSLITS
jgi:hypothetical protein